MKTFLKKITLFACFIFLSSALFAQTETVDMADSFRADGKIYVVIAVISVILIGLFVYLFKLDKKINALEEQFDELEQERK